MSTRELGIEAYPAPAIFEHIHHAPRASWLERNAGTIVGCIAIVAGIVGYIFRCM